MKNGKKLTYVDLLADESIHREYEKALDLVQPGLGKSNPLMIDGGEILSAPEFTVISPFDLRIIVGKFQSSTPAMIRSAIAGAYRGFPAWRDRPWKERSGIIRKTADILDMQKFLLAAVITYESGKNR